MPPRFCSADQASSNSSPLRLRRLSASMMSRFRASRCRRQVARAVAPRQLQGVAPIRLYAVAGLHRDQGGRNDLASHTEGGQLDQSPRWSMPDSMAVVTAQKVVTSQSSKGGLRGGQVQNR